MSNEKSAAPVIGVVCRFLLLVNCQRQDYTICSDRMQGFFAPSQPFPQIPQLPMHRACSPEIRSPCALHKSLTQAGSVRLYSSLQTELRSQLFFRSETDESFIDLSVLEEYERRNAAHTEFYSQRLFFVYIYLADPGV